MNIIFNLTLLVAISVSMSACESLAYDPDEPVLGFAPHGLKGEKLAEWEKQERITFYTERLGEFSGDVILKWVAADEFEFIPDDENPFKYTTHEQDVIQPERFRTNLGSIPKIIQVLPEMTSTGYVPAFVIHDWIYETEKLGINEFEFHEATEIIAESMFTLMHTGKVRMNIHNLDQIRDALSAHGKNYWNSLRKE